MLHAELTKVFWVSVINTELLCEPFPQQVLFRLRTIYNKPLLSFLLYKEFPDIGNTQENIWWFREASSCHRRWGNFRVTRQLPSHPVVTLYAVYHIALCAKNRYVSNHSTWSHVIVATAAWNYLWGKRSAQQQNPISVNSFSNIQCSHTGYSSPDFADRRRILLNICGGLVPLTANENTGWSSEQKAVSFPAHWSIHSWYDKIIPRFCVKLFSARLISGQILNGLNIGFSLQCKFRKLNMIKVLYGFRPLFWHSV